MTAKNITWDAAALKRLEKAPFFVRGMAKRKVEAEAVKQGVHHITEAFMEQVKNRNMT